MRAIVNRIVFGNPLTTSRSDRRRALRYVLEFGAAATLMIMLDLISSRFIPETTGRARVELALLPTAGVIAMSIAIARFCLRLDEMHRHVVLCSAAIAALLTVTACTVVGAFDDATGTPASLTLVYPLYVGLTGLTLPFVNRYYR